MHSHGRIVAYLYRQELPKMKWDFQMASSKSIGWWREENFHQAAFWLSPEIAIINFQLTLTVIGAVSDSHFIWCWNHEAQSEGDRHAQIRIRPPYFRDVFESPENKKSRNPLNLDSIKCVFRLRRPRRKIWLCDRNKMKYRISERRRAADHVSNTRHTASSLARSSHIFVTRLLWLMRRKFNSWYPFQHSQW